MKLLFTGDVQFGRNYWSTKNQCPNDVLKNIINHMNNSDFVFFNLESVIAEPNSISTSDSIGKPFHIINNPNNLVYLKNNTTTPIFVSTVNNHTFDYGIKGYEQTLNTLYNLKYLFTYGQHYLITNDIIYFNATTHWTNMQHLMETRPDITLLWKNHCWFIDIYNHDSVKKANNIIRKVRQQYPNKLLIMSIHWGKNWVNTMSDFVQEEKIAKMFIDSGCNIIFGNGAHHIVPTPYIKYNNGLIIFGLGDLSGDFIQKQMYNTKYSISLMYDTDTHKINVIPFSKIFVNTCGIPVEY